MKNNAKLMELEARIEVLERELRNLKETVEDCIRLRRPEHSKMMELLIADKDEISIDMIKEAALEDFREANKRMKTTTKSYYYALRFIEIVNSYEE